MRRKSQCCGRRKDAAKAGCNMRKFFRAVFPALPKASTLTPQVKQKPITARKRKQKAPAISGFFRVFLLFPSRERTCKAYC